MTGRDAFEGLASRHLPERALRIAMLEVIRPRVSFDFYVWLLTDPESSVGSLPLADVPDRADIPALIRLRYMIKPRWSDDGLDVVSTFRNPAGCEQAQNAEWARRLEDLGVSDVATLVFRDQYGCWGFVDLWRTNGQFSTGECAELGRWATSITSAVRASLLPTFIGPTTQIERHDGPAIVLLDDDLKLLTLTVQADTYLRSLLPAPDASAPIPAVVFNVAAQLLAIEGSVDAHAPRASFPLGGRWLTARAARTQSTAGAGSSIAVSIEVATPADRTSIYARVAGLSGRETEVVGLIVNGADTRDVARALFVSQHTVQDHLKSIFMKTGVNSRRALIARATGSS